MERTTEKIINTKERVEKLLKRHIHYRDNDEKLVSHFWCQQLIEKGFNVNTMTAYDLLKIYAAGEFLTSADLITRARCKIEESNPELRGASYERRHGSGKQVSKEINQI